MQVPTTLHRHSRPLWWRTHHRLACVIASGLLCGSLATAASLHAQELPLPEQNQNALSVDQQQPNVEKLSSTHLPNPVRVHPKVISGGLPEGDAAFAELRELGIKTIISVDGMTPDVATAAKYGLKYIHLPHGYDGIADPRVLEIAKAVKVSEGPIYVHCHHGKHRSPAAAAAACVTAGLIDRAQANKVLEIAGTNPNYRGLFKSVSEANRINDSELDDLNVEFREVEPLPPMADAMVKIEHAFGIMTGFQKRDWANDPKHPDSTAVHEALLLRELYTELLRADYVQTESDGFKSMLADGEAIAKSLEEELNTLQTSELGEGRKHSIKDKLAKLQSNCKACHEAYRDNR